MRRSNARGTRSGRSHEDRVGGWWARRQRIRPAGWLTLGFLGVSGCAPLAPPLAPGLPRAEPLVRVGILVDTSQVEIGATTDFEIEDGASGRVLLRVGAGEQAIVRTDERGELVVRAGQGEARAGTMLLARPLGAGLVSIGGRSYRGSALVRTDGPGRLTAINQVDLENYLLGVLPHEIGEVGEDLLEAAKAQAVAARTYAIRYLGRRDALGFDLFATVQDQVYGGASGEYEVASRAVYGTMGEVIAYRGEPIEAFYHSTCAGRTANIEEVWIGEEPRPYLVSVVDVNPATGEPYDDFSSRFRWTQRWTAEELRQIFNRTLADSLPPGASDVGELRGFETLGLTTSGRIRAMRITTSAGTFQVGSDRIRWIFLTPEDRILNSSKFEIETVRDAQGRIVEVLAHGMGWGHGIGMCQVGAMGRARAGQDYRTILRAYYRGAEVVRLY